MGTRHMSSFWDECNWVLYQQERISVCLELLYTQMYFLLAVMLVCLSSQAMKRYTYLSGLYLHPNIDWFRKLWFQGVCQDVLLSRICKVTGFTLCPIMSHFLPPNSTFYLGITGCHVLRNSFFHFVPFMSLFLQAIIGYQTVKAKCVYIQIQHYKKSTVYLLILSCVKFYLHLQLHD